MIQDKMPSSKLLDGASSGFVKNAPAIAIMGAIIFFIGLLFGGVYLGDYLKVFN